MNTNIIAILIVSVSTNWTTIKHHEGQAIQVGLVETNYSVQVELNGKQVTMDAGKAYADELLTRRIDQVNQNFLFTNKWPIIQWNFPTNGVLFAPSNRYDLPTDSTDLKNNPIDEILWRHLEMLTNTNTFRPFNLKTPQ